MENFNIPTGLLISVILALVTFGFVAVKMGGKAEKAMHDVGTNIGIVQGLIAGLVVFNLCALAIGFPVPNWLVWAWPLVHGPFDTIRDILFGEIDNNGITLFEMKRIFWLLVVCFIILFILFRSHLWILLFFLGIVAVIITSMANSRVISPLPGETAEVVMSYDNKAETGDIYDHSYGLDVPESEILIEPNLSPQTQPQMSFLEKSIRFVRKNYESVLVGLCALVILIGGLITLKPKDWGKIVGNVVVVVLILAVAYFLYAAGIDFRLVLLFGGGSYIIYWIVKVLLHSNGAEEDDAEEDDNVYYED